MSIAITSGKFFASLFALTFSVSAALAAHPEKYTFENDELGTIPKGLFNDVWTDSQKKGVFIYTSNLYGSEGSKKSLHIHALPNSGQCGVRFPFLPKGNKRGIVEFEFDYMREEFGRFQFELKVEDEVWPMVWIEDGFLKVFRGKFYYGKSNIGKIEPYQWYRIKMMFPLTPQDAEHATITFKNLKTGEESKEQWDEPLGSKWCTFMKHPENGANLFWVFHNKTGSDHKFYFDNISLKFIKK